MGTADVSRLFPQVCSLPVWSHYFQPTGVWSRFIYSLCPSFPRLGSQLATIKTNQEVAPGSLDKTITR